MSWEQGDCSRWKRPNWHGPCEYTSSHTTRDTGRRHMRGNLWIFCGAHSSEAGWGVGLGLRLCPFSYVSTNSFPRVPSLPCVMHSNMSMYYPEHRLRGPCPSTSPSYSHRFRQTTDRLQLCPKLRYPIQLENHKGNPVKARARSCWLPAMPNPTHTPT